MKNKKSFYGSIIFMFIVLFNCSIFLKSISSVGLVMLAIGLVFFFFLYFFGGALFTNLFNSIKNNLFSVYGKFSYIVESIIGLLSLLRDAAIRKHFIKELKLTLLVSKIHCKVYLKNTIRKAQISISNRMVGEKKANKKSNYSSDVDGYTFFTIFPDKAIGISIFKILI